MQDPELLNETTDILGEIFWYASNKRDPEEVVNGMRAFGGSQVNK